MLLRELCLLYKMELPNEAMALCSADEQLAETVEQTKKVYGAIKPIVSFRNGFNSITIKANFIFFFS